MNKIEAQMKSLEQVFWVRYPSLNEEDDYTFADLFPALGYGDYKSLFWDMVEDQKLPLIPVIPAQYGGEVTRVALNHH